MSKTEKEIKEEVKEKAKKEKFVNEPLTEIAYEDKHKIKPDVYRKIKSGNKYTVKLYYKKKVVDLTETMRHGLTEFVLLESEGTTETFKFFRDAEVKATKILKGE